MAKKNTFLRALVIYCLVLIVIFAAALIVLRQFLVSYEASRPDNAVIAFMEEKDLQFWLDGADAAIKKGFNEFSDLAAEVSDFGLDPSAELNWRSAVGGDDTTQYYDIRLGSSRFCRLTLIQGESVGFGMNTWEISNLVFSPGNDTTVTIHVPAGATAAINGIEVGSEYLSGSGTIAVTANHSFDLAPISDIYTIEGMRGPVELKAYSAAGKELEPNSISNTEFEFLPEPEFSTLFYAPADALVSINGKDITGTYCQYRGEDLVEEPALCLYECSGLYTQPEISVTLDGEAVSAAELGIGRCYIPGASAEASEEITDFVNDFIKAYVVYSNNQGDSIADNFTALTKYLDTGSRLYTTLLNTQESISWVRQRAVTYRGIDVYDCIPLSDGSYICHVEYRLSIQYPDRVYEPDTVCILHIVPSGNSYSVTAMTNEL